MGISECLNITVTKLSPKFSSLRRFSRKQPKMRVSTNSCAEPFFLKCMAAAQSILHADEFHDIN